MTTNSGGTPGPGGASNSNWFPSDADAIRAAREEVKNLFRTPDQLPRVTPYLSECLRKKVALETQLSSAVRTQVDETRLGLQLLTEASSMMMKMRGNFLEIDQYCRDCKLVLRDSPEIQRVNTARKNLDATTRLLDKFRSLPLQAEALIDELNDSDRNIKSVYKSLRKLFHLRDSAMDQPSSGIGGMTIGGSTGFSADFLAQLQENFAELSKSAATIEERIWENMNDASYLAKEDPITLVRTLEVIEMEDRAMRKVFTNLKKDGTEVATVNPKDKDTKSSKKDKKDVTSSPGSSPKEDPTFLGAPQLVTMREKCLNTLEKSIADGFQHLHIDEEQYKEQQKKEAAERKRLNQLKEEKRKALLAKMGGPTPAPDTRKISIGGGGDDDVDEPQDEFGSSPVRSTGSVGGKTGGGVFHTAEEVDEDDYNDGLDGNGENGDHNAPSDYVLTVLEEMSDLAEHLPDTLSSMLPCFPPDYNLAQFYIERYLRWMKLTLSFHTNDPGKLSKKALLKTVNWIEWYRSELRKWEIKFPGCKTSPVIQDKSLMSDKQAKEATRKEQAEVLYFDNLIRELMKYYTASTEETLIKLCDNILSSEKHAEAERDRDGHYVTSGPPDLFYTINQTIEIVLANFGLNAKPLSFVCVMLSRVFQHYQNSQLAFLQEVQRGEKDQDDQLFFGTPGEEDLIHKSDTYFAAIINNSTICQEHMDELKDKILDRLREAEGIEQATPLLVTTSPTAAALQPKTLLEQMEDLFEECGEGFVTVASEGIDLLVLQISITLQKPMSNLFSPTWLKDAAVTNDIVLTLQDFMTDYKKWIGRDAYFSRMLVKCLHSTVAEYLRILTLTKPQVSAQLFDRLKQDKDMLQEFFLPYTAPELGELLPLQLLKNELRLLTLVNKVVHEDVDFMSVHFDKLISRFGASAKEVMEGLMSMRTDLSKSQRAEVMAKFCEKLPKANSAELLERQLVAQTVAGMAASSSSSSVVSPKPKSKKGQSEESGLMSFWDRFKNRDKEKAANAAATAAAAAAKKKKVDGGMSLQEFTSD